MSGWVSGWVGGYVGGRGTQLQVGAGRGRSSERMRVLVGS